MRDHERADWNQFEQDGHEFVRVAKELWRCTRCGATKDTNNWTSLPDDSWAKLKIGDKELSQVRGDFETCDEACVLAVMLS